MAFPTQQVSESHDMVIVPPVLSRGVVECVHGDPCHELYGFRNEPDLPDTTDDVPAESRAHGLGAGDAVGGASGGGLQAAGALASEPHFLTRNDSLRV